MGTKKDTESTWDKLLNIKTSGRDDIKSDQYRYPYEPPPTVFWNAWQIED